MQFIRKHKFFKVFWMMMVLHFINTSVDPVDPWSGPVPEDLSLNEMETITEIIAEQLLDIENCFEERDEPDTESGQVLKMTKLLSDYVLIFTAFPDISVLRKRTTQPIRFTRLRHQFTPELTSPPPDFAA